MTKISVLGVDIGQSSFYLHGIDERGREVIRKKLTRAKFSAFLATADVGVLAMEACRGAHHWARTALECGHQVRLLHPKYVKPYVKTNKNDGTDAEAICEAVTRPNMRFVPVKTLEQQAIQILHGARTSSVQARTAKANQLRAQLHELGVVIGRGLAQLRRQAPGVIEGLAPTCPAVALRVLQGLYEELQHLDEQVRGYDREVAAIARTNAVCAQLMEIPGVGPLVATALYAKVGSPAHFTNGRHLAAWIGLVPRHWGTGGHTRLYGISKRGDSHLRTLLIHGARAALLAARRRDDRLSRWVCELAARRGSNIACVALANKMARIAWAMMSTGEAYRSAPAGA